MASGPVLIAGAGIGGLTAALALAQRGFEVAIFDQAERLEEIGAGIQLSPNASRILIALGLDERLRRHVVAPEELRGMSARGTRILGRALAAADAVAADLRAPAVNLWFDTDAHLVHYPVRGGSLINVVAIARSDWREPGWSAPAARDEVFARYPAATWPPAARALLAA